MLLVNSVVYKLQTPFLVNECMISKALLPLSRRTCLSILKMTRHPAAGTDQYPTMKLAESRYMVCKDK
jgi:hypothetical protein